LEYIREGGNPVTCPYVPYSEAEILTEEIPDEKTHELKTEYTLVEKEVQMTGDDINDSYVSRNEFGKYEIMIFFNEKGTAEFADLTGANVGRRLAIVIDGQLYSAPVLRTKIDGGTAVITGSFSLEEARRVSAALRRGRRSKGKD
jgi:preprotein translocase subunit SecD